MTEDQAKWIVDIKTMIDFVELHPEFIKDWNGVRLHQFLANGPELAEQATNLGGTWEKQAYGSYYTLVRKFGVHELVLTTSRENVCERKQIGEETVKVPDPNAPMVEVTRPVFEWICPPSILASVPDEA